ncbi:MAG: hypothetical protein RJQ09_08555 [Cyclobacteriaceae bacterium]
MNFKSVFLPIVSSLVALIATAQDGSVEVTGKVIAQDGHNTLPFAHVMSSKWATTTNVDGVFKAPLERNDTIRISYVGYKDFFLTIPDNWQDDKMYREVIMARDTIYLQEAEIFFLPENEEDFKEAILSLELKDREYDYALRNINLLKEQLKFANYDKDVMDASENARHYLSGPQPVYFNFIFDKVREALRKKYGGKVKKDLPDLDAINPSAFSADNNKAGITEEEERLFIDSTTVKTDTAFQYILKPEGKGNR